MSFLSTLGKLAVNTAHGLASTLEGSVDILAGAAKSRSARENLRSGNVIQFVSRSTRRSVQIVVSQSNNELMCDAHGGLGPNYPNAHWFVVAGLNDRYYFHNNYNYLAIRDKQLVIIPSSINANPPIESEFRIQDSLGFAQVAYLESVHMPGHYISFNDDGTPGDKRHLRTKERYSQMEIQLVAIGPAVQSGYDDRTNRIIHSDSAPPSYFEATVASNNKPQSAAYGIYPSSASSKK